MKTTTVTQLKSNLSHYLRAVHSGQEVLVTDRAKPVAMIRRVDAGAGETSLDGLVADGLVKPASRKLALSDFLQRPKAKAKAGLSRAILEDREDR